ncbi:CgeB family protein [Candidatus Phyllobacterium onerii]|uniref:CgeB family protein n=1 Tax=Candidatus Phyllobacterium onerii TaxID=3020828 RepID=UPI00232FD3E7|nr:glycosyltransferase [Phyllobacterium sp. IY22]
MKFLFYTHSLVSDWNHGNAHFLRGVMRDLAIRGHDASALEPADGWSRNNLVAEHGVEPLDAFAQTFPELITRCYDGDFDHEAAVDAADVVIVHEWTDPALVARLGRARRQGAGFTLIFHDTHHRAVSADKDMAGLALADFDIILVFGEALKERYLSAGWGRSVFTWHEAADDTLFHPMPEISKSGDLVWIGNWGDEERSREIDGLLVKPAQDLGVKTTVHGVRYPQNALEALRRAGIEYRGWIANAQVPRVFAENRMTVHVPRRPYVEDLPGIPTIRVFEALACGIPLVSAPWQDAEGLFRPGKDFLFARDRQQMTRHLSDILNDDALAAGLAASGLETIRSRHTCRHRVDELLSILELNGTARAREAAE